MNVYLIKEESWCEYGNTEHLIYPLYDNMDSAIELAKQAIKDIKYANIGNNPSNVDYKAYNDPPTSNIKFDWSMDIYKDEEVSASFSIQVLELFVNDYYNPSDNLETVEFNQIN